MISIKMKTTKGEIHQMAVAMVDDFRRKAIRILDRAGELAVNEARARGSYTDRTGNLRSSVGYTIAENGVPLKTAGFEKVSPTADKGTEVGSNFAVRLAGETKGLALIVVAGMNYAVYVADKGYDVLSSAQILAEKILPELFAKQAAYDEQNR